MALDPFTLEIIRGGLDAICDEMFAGYTRAAQGVVIYETLDVAVAYLNAQGESIAQGCGVPSFISTLDGAVECTLKRFGKDGLFPGDVILVNDPFDGGGTHMSDVAVVVPVFDGDELVGFTANKGHWNELGGKDPGTSTVNSTDIWQEGLQLPCVKIIERNVLVKAVEQIIAANVRTPAQTLGDMWAAIAAARIGERRVGEIVRKYGRKAFLEASDAILDHAEALARSFIRQLPQGNFSATDFIDDDGFTDQAIPLTVAAEIAGDRVILDFTGSAPQSYGPFNTTRTGLVCGARMALLFLLPKNIPTNAGCFRPLEVICPSGTVLTAERPAPVSRYHEPMYGACDVVLKAFAPAMPEKLAAGQILSVCTTLITSHDPLTGDLAVLVEPQAGGWGAWPGSDGATGQFCLGDGDTMNVPVEVAERRYGFRIEEYAILPETAGGGRWRGGNAMVRALLITRDKTTIAAAFGRRKFKPWGLDGGEEGTGNFVEIIRTNGHVETYGRLPRTQLSNGDRVRLITASGGGYGQPTQRSRSDVERDIRNGYISTERAVSIYGWSALDGVSMQAAE